MMEETTVAERIRFFCEEKEMSRYQLATNAFVPITTINNIMWGKTSNPGVYTIAKICDGLGITMKEFFDWEEFEMMEWE
jgi:transcriptional regulator with XRE-family HTH domain